MKHAHWLQKFITTYSELGTKDFSVLSEIYATEVEFVDPLHRISGLDSLVRYFEHLYTNVASCQFAIEHVIESEQEAALYWTMTYQHKRLNGGKAISVEGHSHLKAENGLVLYHRDYLDVGAMLYEHVPLLGNVIRTIKKRSGDV